MTQAQIKPNEPVRPGTFDPNKDSVEPGSPADELFKRAEIKREEEAHRELVERADEGARIGLELIQTFERTANIGAEERKKLDRLEKLAKKIRGGAGGSDEVETPLDLPREPGTSLRMLADAAEDLRKKVSKTSRLVTSAAVVQRSNEVIALVKHVRTFFR